MARPLSVVKKLTDIIEAILNPILGGTVNALKGKPSLAVERMKRLGASGRLRCERPTRDLDEFYYIQDVLSNSPAVDAAIWKLAEDSALDENGDDTAWALDPGVEPADDTEASRTKARELQDELQDIFVDFIVRTNLGYNTKHYIHKMLVAGDCFAECGVYLDSSTGIGHVEQIKELPTWQVSPIWDNNGFLTGYQQQTILNDGNPVIWSIPAQIIHWARDIQGYYPFGRSVICKLRSQWEAFKIIEMDLLAAVHTRAVNPEIHYIGRESGFDNVSDDELMRYKDAILDDPSGINRLYVVRAGRTTIDFSKTGDSAAITTLLDVHRDFEARFANAIGIPQVISGNASGVAGRHIASAMEADYARRINSIRADFTNGIYPVVLLEYALKGYDFTKPELYGVKSIRPKITWPDISESRIQKAKRLVTLYTAGLIDAETALREQGYQDPELHLQKIIAERERGITPVFGQGGTNENISNNDEEGQGVPNGGEEQEHQKQANRRW